MNGAIKDWEPFPALVSQKDGLFTKARNYLPGLFLVHLFMSIKPRDRRVVRCGRSLWTFSCLHCLLSQNQLEPLRTSAFKIRMKTCCCHFPGWPIPLPSASLPFFCPSLYQLPTSDCHSLNSSLWVLFILTLAGTAIAYNKATVTPPYRAQS